MKDIEDYFFEENEKKKINSLLLEWYDKNHRKLDWRTHHSDENKNVEINQKAYHVWVSEIMLQQTKVETVKKYFKKWMEK